MFSQEQRLSDAPNAYGMKTGALNETARDTMVTTDLMPQYVPVTLS